MEIEKEKTFWRSVWELLRFAVVALLIVVPIRVLVVEPFIVSGSSMLPTFENKDYLIVDKISYKIGDPKRNEVVVFRYPNDHTKFFIKRIIGLPGETVDIKEGVVTITNKESNESFELTEPYVKNTYNSNAHLELTSDEYFVMGDNRGASSDSRYWGAVQRDLMVGRALLRLLPLENLDILPGSYRKEN